MNELIEKDGRFGVEVNVDDFVFFNAGTRFGLSKKAGMYYVGDDGGDLGTGSMQQEWAFQTEAERAYFVRLSAAEDENKQLRRRLESANRELAKVEKRRAAARARYAAKKAK